MGLPLLLILCIIFFFYSYTIVTGISTLYNPLNTPNYVSHVHIANYTEYIPTFLNHLFRIYQKVIYSPVLSCVP